MKRMESLFKITGMEFEFQNLEMHFLKRQFSFLIVKTVKCKRDITFRSEKFRTSVNGKIQ